jgi:AcrR family transcriptional regulator
MVQLAHDGTNLEKINDLLTAAQKRFGTYGFEKTTMNEIAQDLGISKAALYYYYPDKENLYKAVVEKETDIFLSLLDEKMATNSNPVELIKIYTEIRLDYFRKLMNLSRVRAEDNQGIKNIMHELRLRFREKEIQKIAEILDQGKIQKQFDFEDSEFLSTMFLNILRGLSLVYKTNRDITYINDEDFSSYKNQIMQFVEIFIKGITK